MPRPGIEPGSSRSQREVLPLYYLGEMVTWNIGNPGVYVLEMQSSEMPKCTNLGRHGHNPIEPEECLAHDQIQVIREEANQLWPDQVLGQAHQEHEIRVRIYSRKRKLQFNDNEFQKTPKLIQSECVLLRSRSPYELIPVECRSIQEAHVLWMAKSDIGNGEQPCQYNVYVDMLNIFTISCKYWTPCEFDMIFYIKLAPMH